jgi:GcrA cell cycle regulator
MSSEWTAARVDQLIVLWADGKTGAEVAAIMGSASRNAVIGKVHRLGLSARPRAPSVTGHRRSKSPQRRTRVNVAAIRIARERPVAIPVVVAAPEAPTAPPVRFAVLGKHDCHYIAGETSGPDTLMCGAPVVRRHLCAFHLRLCWHQRSKTGELSAAS